MNLAAYEQIPGKGRPGPDDVRHLIPRCSWSDDEVLDWAEWLSTSKPRAIGLIRDLIRNAQSDKMTGVDYAICRRGLYLLGAQL